jgi:hypothetical protein
VVKREREGEDEKGRAEGEIQGKDVCVWHC